MVEMEKASPSNLIRPLMRLVNHLLGWSPSNLIRPLSEAND